jgi:hypothetical protein
MSLFQSNAHPNANNSVWLALGTIFLFVAGIFLPALFNHAAYGVFFVISEVVLGVATYFSSKVGFQNTFETNDNWKTGVQALSAAGNLIVPALFVALT